MKAHLSNILTFINYRADLFLISFFLNPAAVGLYVIAVNISERLWIFSQAISSVLFPRISSARDDLDRNRVTSTISRNVFIVSIVGGIIFYFFSDFFIDLFFGSQYGESSVALKLLLLGIVLGSSSRIISNDISGRGKPEINLYTSILIVVTNISFNIILIPIYGIHGAAIATTISYTLDWIIKIAVYKKMSGESFLQFLFIQRSDIQMYMKMVRKLKSGIRGAQ